MTRTKFQTEIAIVGLALLGLVNDVQSSVFNI